MDTPDENQDDYGEQTLIDVCRRFDFYNNGTPEDIEDMLRDMPTIGNA